MHERKIYKHVQTAPARHSKEMRAQTFIGRAAVRGLFLPPQAEWLSDFVAELISFPSSAHYDQVDCLSVLFQALQNIAPGPSPKPKEEPKRLVIGGPGTTICMDDLWAAHDRRRRYSSGRIS